jgi:hypothetical protein
LDVGAFGVRDEDLLVAERRLIVAWIFWRAVKENALATVRA